MSRTAIEVEVIEVLRQRVLLGSDRTLDMDAPLGPGLGLDSLGIMEFVAALEETFETELPDRLWSHREEFTLRRIVDHLDATDTDGRT